MPSKRTGLTRPPVGQPCTECGHEHLTRYGKPACMGHRRFVTDPAAPNFHERLPEPLPCRKPPRPGLDRCASHGAGSPRVAEVGKQRAAEAEIAATARKLIPDIADRTKITNPLETLLELASEANAFRESLRVMANELDGRIRYAANGASGEQLRAEVATYRQALKDTTDLLVAIARLDIEKMLARVTLAQAEQALASMRAGMDEARLTDEQKRTVMTHAGRHLRAVAG